MKQNLIKIFSWWEGKRRLLFNIYALISGLFGLLLLKIIGLPFNFFMLPFVIILGIILNFIYTLAWVILSIISRNITIPDKVNFILFYFILL
jgi:hypothetical protein